MGQIKRGRAIRQPLPPAWPDFNFEKPDAVRTDFVLVRNPRRPKMNSERSKLPLLAFVAFSVLPLQKKSKESKFVSMLGKFSRRGVP